MPSNFDWLIDELQQRAAERSRGSGIVAGEEVTLKSGAAHDFGHTLAGLRRGAESAKRMADLMNRDPLLKGMEADGRRAAESARLARVADKIHAAVRSGAITATEASKLELHLNAARARAA